MIVVRVGSIDELRHSRSIHRPDAQDAVNDVAPHFRNGRYFLNQTGNVSNGLL